jgi:hypothetical protein
VVQAGPDRIATQLDPGPADNDREAGDPRRSRLDLVALSNLVREVVAVLEFPTAQVRAGDYAPVWAASVRHAHGNSP